jgi:transposase
MSKALSVDLRRRVIDAIDGGMSRRQAAEHFSISPSSAIRWHQQHRTTGTLFSRKQGGDRRSARIEAHAGTILALVDETCDITLAEIKEQLAGQGVHAGIGTLWRFFNRRRITRKKRPLTRRSKAARMS